MTSLVEIKQLIKSFYIRYEMWITPLWKFLLSFLALAQINHHIGYLSAIRPLPIVLMCALLCSFMPAGFMVLVASCFVLGHLYAVSIETLGVALVIFLLMFLLYFRFGPGDTIVLLLTPLLFVFRLPYLMPIALGLLGGPVSVAAMSCGVVIYYLLKYVQENATMMGANSVVSGEDNEIIVQLRTFLTGFMTNRTMWVCVIAFACVLVVVWLLRRLPVDHAWKIAIISGGVLNLIILMIGDFLYDTQISFAGVFFGTIFSALLCFVLEFFFFQLDYSRTERVQFEDDDYYYYVKAVPKVTLAETEHHVKKINRTHHAPRNAGHPARRTASYDREADAEEEEEEEVLTERAPSPSRSGMRRGESAQSARSSTARMPSGRPASSAGRRPVSSATRTSGTVRRPVSSRPAASTRNLSGASDEMRDRVLRVGDGDGSPK